MKGGKAIAEGGYGCVFYPELKCKKTSLPKNYKQFISKLQPIKYAKEEYKEIMNVYNKLKGIPNFSKYFLVSNINLCEPDKLTSSDIENFEEKCSSFEVDKQHLNKKLSKFEILNIPFGGIDLTDYIQNITTREQFNKINNSLIELLLNGIIIMNNNNIFHSDIKDTNILVDNNGIPRLIDWGLTTSYNYKSKNGAKDWENRPLTFNNPFSLILFSDDFNYFIQENFINKGLTLTSNNKSQLLNTILSYAYKIKEEENNHYSYLVYMVKTIYGIDSIEANNKFERIFSEYLTVILISFPRPLDYLSKVYCHITDIWGFICCYFCVLQNKYLKREIGTSIIKLFEKYLFSPQITPYNINELVKDLQNT
jgi:serine/threonine protein kinase